MQQWQCTFSFAQISNAMPNGGYSTVKSPFTGHFRQYIDDKNNKKGLNFQSLFLFNQFKFNIATLFNLLYKFLFKCK